MGSVLRRQLVGCQRRSRNTAERTPCCGLHGSPQFLRPVTIHAWALYQQEESSAQSQDYGSNQHKLQEVVQPKTLSHVNRPSRMTGSRNHDEVKQVDAVTHPANAGYPRMAEDCCADPAAEGSEVEHNDQKRKQHVAGIVT